MTSQSLETPLPLGEGGVTSAQPALDRLRAWRDRTLADSRFRAWASRFPLTRPIARRRSRALFDLCAGFAYAQVLQACLELGVFDHLLAGPRSAAALAPLLDLSPERTERLLEAASGLQLLRRRGTRFGLGPLGAAAIDNPGVAAMVRHHALLYRDLADPVALLRAPKGGTNLAAYWPYGTAADPRSLGAEDVAAYSRLMAASQSLVAAEILAAYDVRRHRRLLDVGGGEGAFLLAAGARAPGLELVLFDLPEVAARASSGRIRAVGGDMRADDLPPGADLITLVRVLHDHDDPAAMAILRNLRRATPPGGTLLLAEPMLEAPGAGQVGTYFVCYLLALGSGRPRSAATLTAMLRDAGFGRVVPRPTGNPLLTSVLSAHPV